MLGHTHGILNRLFSGFCHPKMHLKIGRFLETENNQILVCYLVNELLVTCESSHLLFLRLWMPHNEGEVIRPGNEYLGQSTFDRVISIK